MSFENQVEELMREASLKPVPPELSRRLERQTETFFTGKIVPNRGRQWRRVVLSLVTAAAACVALMFITGLGTESSWASELQQISAALKNRKWIHIRSLSGDAERFSMWRDAMGEVVAYSGTDGVYFSNKNTGRYQEYDSVKNLIYDKPIFAADDTASELSAMVGSLIAAMADGREQVIILNETVSIDRRPDLRKKAGKMWIEAVLDINGGQWSLLIDPETHLPRFWQISRGDNSGNLRELVFEYPSSGPTDLTKLPGVQRDARVVIRDFPKSLDDLRNQIQAATDSIEPYVAVVTQDDTASLVWRTRTQSRIETRRANSPEQRLSLKQSNKSFNGWVASVRQLPLTWLSVFNEIDAFYSKVDPETENFVRPNRAQSVMRNGVLVTGGLWHPETAARPDLTMFLNKRARDYRASVQNPSATDAPAPLLLEFWHVEPEKNEENAWDFRRYWIDPERGYLTMRFDEGNVHEGNESVTRVTVVKQVAQSPRGHWYPTVLQSTYKGKTRTFRYSLGFDTSIDATLFATP